jgi:hypothetical protein
MPARMTTSGRSVERARGDERTGRRAAQTCTPVGVSRSRSTTIRPTDVAVAVE